MGLGHAMTKRLTALLLALLVLWAGIPMASGCARAMPRRHCGGCRVPAAMRNCCGNAQVSPTAPEFRARPARPVEPLASLPATPPPGFDTPTPPARALSGARPGRSPITHRLFLRSCALLI